MTKILIRKDGSMHRVYFTINGFARSEGFDSKTSAERFAESVRKDQGIGTQEVKRVERKAKRWLR